MQPQDERNRKDEPSSSNSNLKRDRLSGTTPQRVVKHGTHTSIRLRRSAERIMMVYSPKKGTLGDKRKPLNKLPSSDKQSSERSTVSTNFTTNVDKDKSLSLAIKSRKEDILEDKCTIEKSIPIVARVSSITKVQAPYPFAPGLNEQEEDDKIGWHLACDDYVPPKMEKLPKKERRVCGQKWCTELSLERWRRLGRLAPLRRVATHRYREVLQEEFRFSKSKLKNVNFVVKIHHYPIESGTKHTSEE